MQLFINCYHREKIFDIVKQFSLHLHSIKQEMKIFNIHTHHHMHLTQLSR